MQRQAKESALFHPFAERDDFFAQIQEWLLGPFAILIQQMNYPRLLRDQQAA